MISSKHQFYHIVHRLDKMERNPLLDIIGYPVQIFPVLFWKDTVFPFKWVSSLALLAAMTFSFMPPAGNTFPMSEGSPVMVNPLFNIKISSVFCCFSFSMFRMDVTKSTIFSTHFRFAMFNFISSVWRLLIGVLKPNSCSFWLSSWDCEAHEL